MFYSTFGNTTNPTYSEDPIAVSPNASGTIRVFGEKANGTGTAPSTSLKEQTYYKMEITVTPGKVYTVVYNTDGSVATEYTAALADDYKGGYITLMLNGLNNFKEISIVEYPEISINNYYATPDGNGSMANDNILIERTYGENVDYKEIVPERAGFNFMGFYSDADYENAIDLNDTIDRDATVYTKWSDFADVNADGDIDIRDLVRIDEISEDVAEITIAADIDFDGTAATVLDLSVFRKKLLCDEAISNVSSAAQLMNDGILYPLGRTMVLNDAVEMDHVNTGFVLKGNFEGDVKADFTTNRTGTLLNVSVDSGDNKVIDLNLDGLTTLAEDLTKGEHTIEVINGTSTRYTTTADAENGTQAYDGTLQLNRLYYSGMPLTYKSDKASKILFIGDEITCGFGLGTSLDESGYKESNAYYSYASILGRMLDAQVEVNARCGAKVCHFVWADCGASNNEGRGKGLCNGIDWLKSINVRNSTEYDYANNQPDLVVINLGTNDIPYEKDENGNWVGIWDDTGNKYSEEVPPLLKRVHELYPNAKIIWTVGMMDRNTEISNEYIGYFKSYVETWSAANDNAAYFLDLSDFADLNGYNGHPTTEGHSAAAEEIYNFIIDNNLGINSSDLAELGSVQKTNNVVTLSISTVENTTEELELTFPKTGGIRLSGANKGIHEAESNRSITYSETGNVTVITADDDSYINLIKESDDWSIDFYNSSKEKVKSIKGSQIVFYYNNNAEIIKTSITGTVKENEKFTGLGERFNGLVQNGDVITLWNSDCKSSNFAEDADKTASYINIPFLNSTNGYSIFLNSSYKTIADIAATNKDIYTLTTNGDIFDMYCFVGDTNDNLNSYTNLTGKSALPPKWAFSYMAGNHSKVWGSNPVSYLTTVMEKYKALGTIPSAVYGEYGPEYAEESYSILSNYGSRMIGWQDSGVYFSSIDKYMDGITGEYPLIKTLYNNKTYMSGGTSGDAYIDFTNPFGKLLFKNRILQRVNWGWKGGMIDFGDDVLVDSISYNGMTGNQMHNLYPYYYTKSVSEALKESIGDDYFAFSRSGYAGSQKYMGVFTGDHPSSFQGLKQSLYGGLSLSSSGYSIWGSDIGGHGKQGDTNDADLYRRWLQFATFSPLMRAHGVTDRNPWSYNMNDEFKKYYWIRENFVDAIYSSAIKSSVDGSAMTQPLMNAFPNQSSLYSVEDEYMFCDELLVAPVTEAGATSRSVVLPNGKWINFWTGVEVEGGSTQNVSADASTIPLFLRSSAVMPVRLNSDFIFGTDLNDGEIINALMLTEAEETRNVTVYSSETDSENYIISKTANGATSVKAENSSNIRMFIIKGAKASSITVDSTVLSSTSSTPTSQNTGFKVSGNDTYVFLPEGEWNEIVIAK